jgi:DNA-binding transcriptional MerR regulator
MLATEEALTATEATRAAGCTYRQLDYWTRTGLIETAGDPTPGSGGTRYYSARELFLVRAALALRDCGADLGAVRRAMPELRALDRLEGRVHVSRWGHVARIPSMAWSAYWTLNLDALGTLDG